MNSAATFSQRLPTPRELGGWKLAMNPIALLFWLYLRRLFGCLDILMADFAAGRLDTTEPTATRRRTTARSAARKNPAAAKPARASQSPDQPAPESRPAPTARPVLSRPRATPDAAPPFPPAPPRQIRDPPALRTAPPPHATAPRSDRK